MYHGSYFFSYNFMNKTIQSYLVLRFCFIFLLLIYVPIWVGWGNKYMKQSFHNKINYMFLRLWSF